MKKLLLSTLFLLIALFSWAKEVTEQQAKEIAIQFINSRVAKPVSIQSIHAIGKNVCAYYVVNFTPQGWAIIAGDDVVEPIIGYSHAGNLKMQSLPDNMKFMLDTYEQEITRIAKKETTQHPQWINPKLMTRASGNEILPLIKVNWNQGAPYNKYCPQKKALVGCVAVAMGQAMSVQRYPARATGKVSYTSPNYGGLSINFDNEMAYNWDDILSAAQEYDEVARLLYHAGMSVKMDYGVDASGIPSNEVNRISDALKDVFSYPESVGYVWKDNYDGDWEQLLINELNAGRPIIYNAIDTKKSAGHSFDVDGFDGNGHFHVNWGWGGHANGNFLLSNLRDGTSFYNAGHVAIIGIGAPTQKLKSISLSNNRIEENLPKGAVVGSVRVNDKELESSYTVRANGVRGQEIPFIIENGMLKTTQVLSATTSRWEVEITVDDKDSGASLTQGFRIIVDPWRSLEKTTSIKYNRQLHMFTLTTKHNVVYKIVDENNTVLQEGSLTPLPELKINTNMLPAGKNTIELKCADESKKIQIISKQH